MPRTIHRRPGDHPGEPQSNRCGGCQPEVIGYTSHHRTSQPQQQEDRHGHRRNRI